MTGTIGALLKQEWLQRQAPGALRYNPFSLSDVQARPSGGPSDD
jgi:hypothetical protein